MVALALDIGETRIGIAVSSRDGKMAMPVKVLPAAEVTGMAKTFRYLVEDYEPDILVSGRPLTMAGEPGPQAERVAAVAQKIADELDLPLEFEDERLSSQEAKRILREQGLNEKQMRGKIDMIAASLFLQTWLDRKNEEVSACLALPIRASRIVHSSRRRALLSLVSVRRSRRSAQLSLPRARRSPSLVRPNLFNGRVSSLLLVRFSIRLLTRLSSPLLVRPSLQAAPALSSRHLPSERRPPNRIRITLVVRMALLRPTRSSYNTHARRGAQKKSSPVPMIIGGVVAVLALVAIVFFVVPAVKGFFGGEGAKVAAGQQVTITIPDGASGDSDRFDSLREPYRRKSQGLLCGGEKAQRRYVAQAW